MRNINFTQFEDVIHVYDSSTGKFEEVKMASPKINENRKTTIIPANPSLAAHIALQISTA